MSLRAHSRTGFTLLEIILAVTMLALVITAVYGTWNAALKSWKRGTDVAETFQRQRIVMDTLSELAQSMTFRQRIHHDALALKRCLSWPNR